MKIALANNLFYPHNKGGAEKVLYEMADQYIAKNNEVIIITTAPKKKEELRALDSSYKIYQIPSSLYNLADFSKARRFFWHLNNFCNPKKRITLMKILKKEKPDLLITHNLVGLGFFLSQIASKLKIKHQHFLHDVQLLHPSGLMMLGEEENMDKLSSKIYQSLTKRYFKKTDKIISPSEWLLKEHLQRGFFLNKETEIRRLRQDNHINNNITAPNKQFGSNFLFVGQLEKHKGLALLLNSFSQLKNKDASLRIVGTGLEEKLVNKAQSNDRRIEYLGYLESNQVKEEMRKACFLIVPSLCYENSPTIIYEANEQSLRIIAADIGGISEIIKSSDILFKAGDEGDLLEKLNNACLPGPHIL